MFGCHCESGTLNLGGKISSSNEKFTHSGNIFCRCDGERKFVLLLTIRALERCVARSQPFSSVQIFIVSQFISSKPSDCEVYYKVDFFLSVKLNIIPCFFAYKASCVFAIV